MLMINLMAITMKMNMVIEMVIIEGGVWLGQYCLGSDPERGGNWEGGGEGSTMRNPTQEQMADGVGRVKVN